MSEREVRDTRQGPRAMHELEVELQIGEARHAATSRNVSTGGMFISTQLALKTGERIKLSFKVPAQREPISAIAEVRWTEKGGVGVSFLNLRAKEVWALGKLLSDVGVK